MFPNDIFIRIWKNPSECTNGFNPLLGKALFGLSVIVRGYLLVRTSDPRPKTADATEYLVLNDDLRYSIISYRGADKLEPLGRHLPVGQTTGIPLPCCAVHQRTSMLTLVSLPPPNYIHPDLAQVMIGKNFPYQHPITDTPLMIPGGLGQCYLLKKCVVQATLNELLGIERASTLNGYFPPGQYLHLPLGHCELSSIESAACS